MARLTSARRAPTLTLPLALLLLAACSGGPTTPPIDSGPTFDAPWSPSCVEAMNHSDFDWINEEIFNKSCANFTSCHQGNSPAGHLNLTLSRSFGELVKACDTCPPEPSEYFGDWLRVKPCSPEESYLMVKLRCFDPSEEFGSSCEHGPLDGGSLMPPKLAPHLRPQGRGHPPLDHARRSGGRDRGPVRARCRARFGHPGRRHS
jgi:hypothetical protein